MLSKIASQGRLSCKGHLSCDTRGNSAVHFHCTGLQGERVI